MAVRLYVAALVLATASCAESQTSFDDLMNAVDQRDACIEAVHNVMQPVERNLQAEDIHQLISRVFVALPSEIRSVFMHAATTAAFDIAEHGRDGSNERMLMLKLRAATYEAFASELDLGGGGCGYAAIELVPSFLYRHQQLDDSPLADRFTDLGLDNRFLMEQAVLLMLTMEASGTGWDPEWFSAVSSISKGCIS